MFSSHRSHKIRIAALCCSGLIIPETFFTLPFLMICSIIPDPARGRRLLTNRSHYQQ